ncbi:MAG: hypothetical protein BGO06_07670 [Shinella sp. 65-6]|nr:MAG: hypothetical protein BGO06_07670 [Shinella sp. 65-6]
MRFLACQLAGTPHGFRLLAHSLFRRLFKGAPCLHFAEKAFPLHLLFQNAKGLIDIVVPYENLQDISFR